MDSLLMSTHQVGLTVLLRSKMRRFCAHNFLLNLCESIKGRMREHK